MTERTLPEGEMLPVQALFNYDVLDAETREFARQSADEIRQLSESAAQQIIKIGKSLIAVQERLPRGAWMPWLRDEFQWSVTHANKLIHLARIFGDVDLSGKNISTSTLKLLSSPSLPSTFHQEAVKTIVSAESLSKHDAREMVKRVDPQLAEVFENTEHQRQKRERHQATHLAHEIHTVARNLQVALAEAYGVPLRAPVGRALQRLFDLALTLEDDEKRAALVPRQRPFPSRKSAKSKSPYWGVSRHKRMQKWSARVQGININAKGRIHIGYFDTEEEAARAYDAKARELYGDAARLNFPDERP